MEVKGTAISYLPNFVRMKFGETELERWLNSIDEKAREVYRKGVILSQWYDFKTFSVYPRKKLIDMFYAGKEEFAVDIGVFAADYALKGVYSAYIRVASPQSVLKRAPMILSGYYKPSKMEVVESSKNHGVLRITEFPEMDRMHEYIIEGYIKKAGELSGAKNIRINITRSLVSGDPCTEYDISWE
jgi:uncharacterized protein (TIGR02265 family)